MFLFQHPEEYLRSLEIERERRERRNRLLREMRGATPPFGEGTTRRLTAAFAEASSLGEAFPERRGVGVRGPDMNEALTP